MEIKGLKKVMEAIELLHNEKLISEKVASKYLTDYLEKKHQEKQEQTNRLAEAVSQETINGYKNAKYGQE